jgi:hypothetical protein
MILNIQYVIYILDRIYLGEFLAAPPFNEPLPCQTEREKEIWRCGRSQLFRGKMGSSRIVQKMYLIVRCNVP